MLDTILFFICFTSLFLFGIPSIFILPYTLGKKFDRIMEKHNFSLPASLGIMPPYVYRSNMYAFNICLPNPKTHPKFMKYYKRWFGNFWFREHASTWDKIQV